MKTLFKLLSGLLLLAVVSVGALAGYLYFTFDPNDHRDAIAQQASQQLGRKITLDGPLAFEVFPNLVLSASDVTVANADWAGKEPMASVKSLHASLALMPLLNKEIMVDGITLKGANFNLVQQGSRNNWTFNVKDKKEVKETTNTSASEKPIKPLSWEVLALNISDTKLNFKKDGKTTKLNLRDLKTSLRPTQPMAVSANGELDGKDFIVDITGDRLELLMSGAQSFPIKGNLKLAGSRADFSGTIKNPTDFSGADLDLSVSGNGYDLAALGAAMPFADFALKTKLVMPNKDTAELRNLQFSTGSTSVSGNLKTTLGNKMNVTGDVNIPVLNINDFQNGKKSAALFIKPAHAADDGRLVPAIPLPSGGLNDLRGNIKLNIGQFVQDGKTLANFKGLVGMNDGVITVSGMTLGFAENIFTGNIRLDSRSTPALSANLASSNLDYGKFLKALQLNDRITGTGSFDLSFSGIGADLRQVMASSRGTLRAQSNEGQFDTGILFDDAGNILRLVAPDVSIPRVAQVNCAYFDFTGQNGTWQTTSSAVDSNVLALQMSGDVSLVNDRINLKTFPNLKMTKGGSLIPPIKFAGNIMRPAVKVDGSGLAQTAVTAAVLGKTKAIDLLRSLGKGGETAPNTNASNACLAKVQATAASAAPKKSTGEQARDLLNEAVPQEKQQQLQQELNNKLQKGLEGLFGN